jgi:hypothetical protein
MRRTPPVPKLRKNDTVWVQPKLTAKIAYHGVAEVGCFAIRRLKGWINYRK